MERHPLEEARPKNRLSLYELALLLAEGQTGDVNARWEVFIDNLARITDAFAQARVRAERARSGAPEPDALQPA